MPQQPNNSLTVRTWLAGFWTICEIRCRYFNATNHCDRLCRAATRLSASPLPPNAYMHKL